MSTMTVPVLEIQIVPNVTDYFPEYTGIVETMDVGVVDQTFRPRSAHLNTPGVADVELEIVHAATIALEVTL